MKRAFVVDCDFLARCNVTQSDEQNVPVQNFHEGAGLTRVINVVRTVTTATAVKTPAVVNGTNSKSASPGPAISLGVGDSFASVFSYFAAAFKVSH